MPRPIKRYVGSSPIYPRMLNENDLVIPAPLLQGFLRGVLSETKIPAADRARAEHILFHHALSLTDERWALTLKDSSPQSVADRAAQSVARAFHRIRQEHLPEVLQVQADILAIELQKYPVKARNDAYRSAWLRDNLVSILKQLRTCGSTDNEINACSARCRRLVTLPKEERLGSMAKLTTIAGLRIAILAYYHAIHPATAQQLLSGR